MFIAEFKYTYVDANSVDPRSDCSQEQSDLDLHCLSKTLQNILQTTKTDDLLLLAF